MPHTQRKRPSWSGWSTRSLGVGNYQVPDLPSARWASVLADANLAKLHTLYHVGAILRKLAPRWEHVPALEALVSLVRRWDQHLRALPDDYRMKLWYAGVEGFWGRAEALGVLRIVRDQAQAALRVLYQDAHAAAVPIQAAWRGWATRKAVTDDLDCAEGHGLLLLRVRRNLRLEHEDGR